LDGLSSENKARLVLMKFLVAMQIPPSSGNEVPRVPTVQEHESRILSSRPDALY
jgi:hypothetical protein